MLKKLLLVFTAMCMLTGLAYAQELKVSGTVTSAEDGASLPGVNVIVKGTSQGTITDIDGNYTIAASKDDVLVFSYIGFLAQEIALDNSTTVNVSMRLDATQLSEVVVTAYGQTTKKDFTGSASTVSAEDFALRPVTNPIAAIEGNATGVQFINSSGAPGSSPEIVIRGVGTLNGGTTNPLFIVVWCAV